MGKVKLVEMQAKSLNYDSNQSDDSEVKEEKVEEEDVKRMWNDQEKTVFLLANSGVVDEGNEVKRKYAPNLVGMDSVSLLCLDDCLFWTCVFVFVWVRIECGPKKIKKKQETKAKNWLKEFYLGRNDAFYNEFCFFFSYRLVFSFRVSNAFSK